MQIQIEKIVYPGKSLSSLDGKVVLTDEGLPGEIVEIHSVKEKKNYILAKTVKILKESGKRVPSRCDHYKTCSSYQCIDYPFQIDIKKSQIQEIFSHDLKIKLDDLIVLPSPKIWGYRNKIRLHLLWEDGVAHLAYHQPGTQNEFVKVRECFLISDRMNSFLTCLVKIITDKKLEYIKEVELREGNSGRDLLLMLYVHSREELKELAANLSDLKLKFPLKGLVCFLTEKKLPNKIIVEGKNFIELKAADKIFWVGPQSFFQINLDMMNQLLEDIRNFLHLKGKEKIADLYCGLGTFGITLASNAREVIGVELALENISFLKKNLSLNRVGNFTICEGKVEDWTHWILKKGIDILIMDPPRKGVEEDFINKLLRKPVPLIIYVSCNPSTLTRDMKLLLAGYRLKDLRVYDFFPHTPHLETCSFLERK